VDKTRAHSASRGGRIVRAFEENIITTNNLHIKAKYKAYRTENYAVYKEKFGDTHNTTISTQVSLKEKRDE
jgi:hypothetical protein